MNPLILSFILGCQEKKDATTEEVIEDTQVIDTGNTDDTDDTDNSDSGNTDNSDSGNTDNTDSGNTDDTDNSETGDTDNSDSGNTDDTAIDTADTGSTEDTGDPVDTGIPPNPVMDFSRVDVNPNSASFGTSISPRDYLQQISGWYFIKAT
jgi:hypothetical protein